MEMNGFIVFLGIVYMVAGILGLVLFFKVWGMTNNVKKMLDKMSEMEKNQSEIIHSLRIIEYNQSKK